MRIFKKLAKIYRREILRDHFLLEIKRWFKDKGDSTLRLNYPLGPNSVVWDLGGYKGDFAEAIHKRYGSKVFLFEPHPEFHSHSETRFTGNPKIVSLMYGLSNKAGWFSLSDSKDASSFALDSNSENKAEVRVASEVFQALEMQAVDLIKINIEGGEFEVLPDLISSGLISKFNFLQIQFHNFIPDADKKRDDICRALEKTHERMWNYDFVWESWKKRSPT